MNFRDYTYLGMTQSLCPACLAVVPAKILSRDGRVYFRKHCPQHGTREDFVCSDAKWFDRNEFLTPAKQPRWMAVEPARGCPYDCGLCTEHEQHTCLAVLEITSSCNLECPMCYASSGPGGVHLSYDECRQAIDHLVFAEGQPEVLQLSGGEPTIHPQFLDILQYACAQPIDMVMINSNGVRFARDPRFVEAVAAQRHRAEVYLQFDSFKESGCQALRGEPLVETKYKAVEALGDAGINTILVCTVQPGVNDDELGAIVEFAQQRSWITGVSFQPACYVGRTVEPAELENRITFPDVIQGLAAQLPDTWSESDFSPLPCAHPNAHALAYAYRANDCVIPLARFIDITEHIDLLSGGITFNRPRARQLITELLSRQGCCSGGCDCVNDNLTPASELNDHNTDRQPKEAANSLPAVFGELWRDVADEFFRRALDEDVYPRDMFRITTTSFMDAYNFDVRQAMKDCVHFILPSGHLIPFSAYNILYRDGHVRLPPRRPTPLVELETTPSHS